MLLGLSHAGRLVGAWTMSGGARAGLDRDAKKRPPFRPAAAAAASLSASSPACSSMPLASHLLRSSGGGGTTQFLHDSLIDYRSPLGWKGLRGYGGSISSLVLLFSRIVCSNACVNFRFPMLLLIGCCSCVHFFGFDGLQYIEAGQVENFYRCSQYSCTPHSPLLSVAAGLATFGPPQPLSFGQPPSPPPKKDK